MSRGTLDPALSPAASLTGISPSLSALPRDVLLQLMISSGGPNPRALAPGFGLFPFRSPLLRKSLLFSFPPAT